MLRDASPESLRDVLRDVSRRVGELHLGIVSSYFAYGNWCRSGPGVGCSPNLRMVKRMAKRLPQPAQWPQRLQMRQPAVEVRCAVFLGSAAFLGGINPDVYYIMAMAMAMIRMIAILSRFNFNAGHLCNKMERSRHALIRQGNPLPVCLPQRHSRAA